jgi:hypothetical protein
VLGVDLGDPLSEKLGLLLEPGVETAGDRAFRKSVYAVGGVMGVFASSSCLMTSSSPGAGLLGSSEGNVADLGVLSGGSSGFGERGVSMVGSSVLEDGRFEETGGMTAGRRPSKILQRRCQMNDSRAAWWRCLRLAKSEPWQQQQEQVRLWKGRGDIWEVTKTQASTYPKMCTLQ